MQSQAPGHHPKLHELRTKYGLELGVRIKETPGDIDPLHEVPFKRAMGPF